jgi:hypothetical protein
VTVTFNNLPDGTYDLLIVAKNPASGVSSAIQDSNTITLPVAADVTAPEAEDTELTSVGGFPDLIDNGDVIKICFDDTMGALSDADVEALQLTDGDGTVVQLTSGGNATFALNAAVSTATDDGAGAAGCPINAELTVTITAAPSLIAAGGVAGLQSASASITNSADIEDDAGNLFAPAGDNDVDVDVEAGPEPD